MPRSFALANAVTEIASAQDGLITSRQLALLGVARSTIAYRNRQGGMWNRLLPGVHLIDARDPSERQRLRAASLYCGEQSSITGQSALRLYGVRATDRAWASGRVHMLIPWHQVRQSSGFLIVERTRFLPEPNLIDGLALAPLPRAAVDAAHRMRDAADARALVAELVRRGLVTTVQLKAELIQGTRRGSAFLREALDHVEHGSWSGPEADLRATLLASGLPEPHWNALITDPGGSRIAIVDALFDDVWLALEVDSREHHSGVEAFELTMRRSAKLTSYGVIVLHLSPTRIRMDPAGVVAEIRAARGALSGRPLPTLRWTPAALPATWLSEPA